MAATTLDPSTIVNFSGSGSLSNGNLTFSSTGISFVLSTRGATGKQTFECDDFHSVRNSVNGSGFLFDHDGSNWLLEDAAGNVLATGPSTPAPVAGGIFTIDCDRPNELVSMRYNGTPVFSNEGVSGIGLSTWKVQLFASSGRSPTVAFSNLTYAPLAGFSEWDTSGVALATAGGVDVSGPVAHAAATAHVSAIASPASVEVKGSIGTAAATAHVSALAATGQVSASGHPALSVASDHKVALPTAGRVDVLGAPTYATVGRNAFAVAGTSEAVGSSGIAAATQNRLALASPGSVNLSGRAGKAVVDVAALAARGLVSTVGARPISVVSYHARALASAGRLTIEGRRARAFSLPSVLSREQTAIVPAENRTVHVAHELRRAIVSADTPRDRSASVPGERRISIAAGEKESRAAPERRNAVA